MWSDTNGSQGLNEGISMVVLGVYFFLFYYLKENVHIYFNLWAIFSEG